MSRNAQRKHAKANRRKKALEERRRLEAGAGGGKLAREVHRAAAAPLHACMVQDSVFQSGAGMVFLSRKTGARDFALGAFLVDAFCLGVKDAMFREMDQDELELILEETAATAPLAEVDPPYARKLLRDAAEYARSLGQPPHPDFPTVEFLFGDVAAEACDVKFQFGHEGRPFYVPGPSESRTQIRRRIDSLRRKLGDDGFDFGMPQDAFDAADEWDDEADDPDDGGAGYDPDKDPDPADWLALEEAERLRQVTDYHLCHDDLLANLDIHAVVHLVIENQIALGDETPVRRCLERLMAEGLSRHEAVHALGSAFAGIVVSDDEKAERFGVDAYHEAIRRLTAENWRRLAHDE